MGDTDERWLPVVGYEGTYEVSDLGRVRSLDRMVRVRDRRRERRQPGKVLSPGRTGERLTVSLSGRSHYVHVLVLTAFAGPRPTPEAECCHENGDGTDNPLSNLRWDTRAENTRDRVRHGTHHMAKRKRCPRKHLLRAPNLVACDDGRRCLACNRTQGSARYARKMGRPFNFKAEADRRYKQIMAGADRSTPRTAEVLAAVA